jgi:hypothetical protein
LEFLEGNAAFGLQTDVDDGDVFFDGNDDSLDDGAFQGIILAIALVEKCGKILARRRVGLSGRHFFS